MRKSASAGGANLALIIAASGGWSEATLQVESSILAAFLLFGSFFVSYFK